MKKGLFKILLIIALLTFSAMPTKAKSSIAEEITPIGPDVSSTEDSIKDGLDSALDSIKDGLDSITGKDDEKQEEEYDPEDDKFNTNCANFAKPLRMAGYIILLVKIVLPLIIIVKTSMSLLPLITSGSEKEIGKIAKKAGISLISAIIIFFIPTLINVIFGFISNFEENKSYDINICSTCIFDPFDENCSKYADKEW